MDCVIQGANDGDHGTESSLCDHRCVTFGGDPLRQAPSYLIYIRETFLDQTR